MFIDLNVGMGRTGIAPTDAPQLAADCAGLPGIRVVGLHGYDGHIRDSDVPTRSRHADMGYEQAITARQAIESAQQEPLVLIMGGTPTSTIHAQRKGDRVQTSPGTFVFWDAGYARQLPDLPYDIAAMLLTRVISVIDDQTLTLDLGHKSVAAENPQPRVWFPDHPDAQLVGQSEEHLVVNLPDAQQHLPGEVWYGVPKHICPTWRSTNRCRWWKMASDMAVRRVGNDGVKRLRHHCTLEGYSLLNCSLGCAVGLRLRSG